MKHGAKFFRWLCWNGGTASNSGPSADCEAAAVNGGFFCTQTPSQSEFMEVYLWNFSIVQLILCRPSLWASAARFAYGAASIFWRDTGRTTLQAMLMYGKVTNDNLIDSSHYFRNTDQYEKLMWGFSYISFCLSKHFGESDVFVSFLLTASL